MLLLWLCLLQGVLGNLLQEEFSGRTPEVQICAAGELLP